MTISGPVLGSTPASDLNTWSSFTEFMAMDSGSQLAAAHDLDAAGLYTNSCNSSECKSPFTASTSSLDSVGAAGRRKQRKLEASLATPLQQQKEQATSHKRSLSNSNGGAGMGLKEMLCATNLQQAKRIKCDDRVSTSPQLLQQLMAPAKAHGKAASRRTAEVKMAVKEGLENSSSRLVAKGHEEVKKEQQQQQGNGPSSSVLMNLLVSGCDVSAGYMCLVPVRPRKAAKV